MLQLENIKKSYDGVTILDRISFDINDGEIVSILGPSGCGKTTLLNMILGITECDSGKMIFNGKDITDVPMEKRGFNIVFQDYALFPNLNVYKNITYGLRQQEHIDAGRGERAYKTSRTGAPSRKEDRSAFGRTETACSAGKDDGDEAENTSARRAAERS